MLTLTHIIVLGILRKPQFQTFYYIPIIQNTLPSTVQTLTNLKICEKRAKIQLDHSKHPE